MNKSKRNNFINIILILFLLIQPIFDTKYFYNSISTLIRVIIIFSVFLYYFITSKNNKKYLLLIYPAILRYLFYFPSYKCYEIQFFSTRKFQLFRYQRSFILCKNAISFFVNLFII